MKLALAQTIRRDTTKQPMEALIEQTLPNHSDIVASFRGRHECFALVGINWSNGLPVGIKTALIAASQSELVTEACDRNESLPNDDRSRIKFHRGSQLLKSEEERMCCLSVMADAANRAMEAVYKETQQVRA